MGKINPKIVENLKEADKIKNDKIYGLFDEMILSRCTGRRTRDTDLDRELVRSVWGWLINKGLSANKINIKYEYYWNNWSKVFKEDFYRIFIESFNKNDFTEYLVVSMSEVIYWNTEARYFRDLIRKCGIYESIKFYSQFNIPDEDITWDMIDTIIGVYKNYGFVIWAYVSKTKGVVKVEIREPSERIGNLKHIIDFKKYIALEDFVEYTRVGDVYDFIDGFTRANLAEVKSIRNHSLTGEPLTDYGALLELYTGYLKYGSVNNYRKNCLENKMLI